MSLPSLTDHVGDTQVRYGDLALIGSYVLNAVNAAEMMRHASPAGLLDYASPDGEWAQLVLDFIQWTSRGSAKDPGVRSAADRLLAYVHSTGWAAMKLAEVSA